MEVERASPTGRRGVAVARALVAAGEPLSSSPLETALRLVITAAGLPRPVAQHVVRDGNGRFLGRVDFAWIESRVVLEADGRRWHEAPGALLADRRRQNALAAAGWTVLRATWADAATPDSLLGALRQLVG